MKVYIVYCEITYGGCETYDVALFSKEADARKFCKKKAESNKIDRFFYKAKTVDYWVKGLN